MRCIKKTIELYILKNEKKETKIIECGIKN